MSWAFGAGKIADILSHLEISMQAEQSSQPGIREVGRLIEKVKVAMLVTRTPAGHLVSRPLRTRAVDFDGSIWFFTSMSSDKVSELLADPHVNVAYANEREGVYVSIDGRACIVTDRARIDELWIEAIDSLYFDGGKDDPEVVLVRIDTESAECWTAAETSVGRAFRFIKARLTGDVGDLGRQKHVDLLTGALVDKPRR